MDDEEWWVRRAVLSGLAVLGVVTAVFAIVAVRSGPPPSDEPGDVEVGEAVTAYTPAPTPTDGPLRLDQMLVVGRMGSPVERPGGTLESYEAAFESGAQFVEARVVVTSDEQLVIRDDNELSATTDVASRSEFADRSTTKVVDGVTRTGWFTEDFTLEELQGLNAVEAAPDLHPDAATYDEQLPVLSFDDLLARLREVSLEEGREIGLFVEPLRPAYFRQEGKPIERAVAKSLRKARLVNEAGLVTIASDELRLLERLEDNLGDNVLSAYIVDAESADELEPDALATLPDTLDAVLVETGAFAGACPYDFADDLHAEDLAMGVFPVSYLNAQLGNFADGDDPAARGNLDGLVAGLAITGVDVVLADSPAEVVESIAGLEADLTRPELAACEES